MCGPGCEPEPPDPERDAKWVAGQKKLRRDTERKEYVLAILSGLCKDDSDRPGDASRIASLAWEIAEQVILEREKRGY